MVYSGMGPDYRGTSRQGTQSLTHRLQAHLQRVPTDENISAGCCASYAEATQSGWCTAVRSEPVDCWWDEGIEPETEGAATTDVHPDEKKAQERLVAS